MMVFKNEFICAFLALFSCVMPMLHFLSLHYHISQLANMLIICLFIFTGLALGAPPVNFRSPLYVSELGGLFTNVTTGIRVAPNTSLELSLGSYSQIRAIPSIEDVISINFTSSSGSERFSIFVDRCLPFRAGPGSSVLAIGPLSSIVRYVGSIGILKDGYRAEMVLGSTLESFNNFCQPDSLMRLMTTQSSYMEASYGLLNGTIVEVFENRYFIMNRSRGLKASVPRALLNGIHDLIIHDGGSRLISPP